MAAPHSRRSAVGRPVGILVGKVKGLRWDSKLTGAVGEGPGRDQTAGDRGACLPYWGE